MDTTRQQKQALEGIHYDKKMEQTGWNKQEIKIYAFNSLAAPSGFTRMNYDEIDDDEK